MTIDKETRQKIYLEWVEEAKRNDPRKHDDEFTLKDFAKDAHVGRDTALKILEQKIAIGELSKRITSRGEYYSLVV